MASTTGFTIHHLPYGVITTPNNNTPHLATAYQDYAIDLATLVNQGLLKGNADSTVLKHALSVSFPIMTKAPTSLIRFKFLPRVILLREASDG